MIFYKLIFGLHSVSSGTHSSEKKILDFLLSGFIGAIMLKRLMYKLKRAWVMVPLIGEFGE